MSRSPRQLARRLPGAARLRRIGDRFMRDRVDGELAQLRARLDEVASMRPLLDEHERSRHEHWARLGSLADDVNRLRDDLGGLRFDVERIVPVVSALEERVERLRRAIESPADAAPGTIGLVTVESAGSAEEAGAASEVARAAGDLLTEIRREHAQVRARLSAVAAYEERLRRLEVG
jgi:hypothetical protein